MQINISKFLCLKDIEDKVLLFENFNTLNSYSTDFVQNLLDSFFNVIIILNKCTEYQLLCFSNIANWIFSLREIANKKCCDLHFSYNEVALTIQEIFLNMISSIKEKDTELLSYFLDEHTSISILIKGCI